MDTPEGTVPIRYTSTPSLPARGSAAAYHHTEPVERRLSLRRMGCLPTPQISTRSAATTRVIHTIQ